jgi:hypothetical protein
LDVYEAKDWLLPAQAALMELLLRPTGDGRR